MDFSDLPRLSHDGPPKALRLFGGLALLIVLSSVVGTNPQPGLHGKGLAVMVALIAFQNPDGGFGHGLEPDTRSPASSGIASSIGSLAIRSVC